MLLAWAVTVSPMGTTCPSRDAVAAELDRLGAVAALANLGSPEITVKDTKMRVVLRGRDGSTLGTREVAAPEDCNERATVAAVFIAAWVGAWTTTPLDEAQAVKLDVNPAVFPSSLPPPRARAADPASPTSLPLREQGEAAKADVAKPPEAKAAPPDTKAPEAVPAAAVESKPVAVAAEKRGL